MIDHRLDRTPRGRNESLFVGAGDLRAGVWYRRHDEYGAELSGRMIFGSASP